MTKNPQIISGIGIDIVDIKRIKKLVETTSFLKRFFAAPEIKYCLKGKNKFERIAARFAAKEAVIKATGLKKLALKDIVLIKDKTGKPSIEIKNKKYSGLNALVSLSHTADYACASVVVINHQVTGKQVSGHK
ncbi:MAG: holo-ACP synthase [Elusimicrobiales bacterium]|nr:holo-ACP synthase [Elusimicrobiales bacterium]MCK5358071.1 holo-ACP synthase [Elusimicrobiales bacterium]MCK5582728.1 holo-ACP synthase [Elusimicrobiales bacterium]